MSELVQVKPRTGMIALCDILGFSNWICTTPVAQVANEFRNVVLHSLYYSMHKKDPESLDRVDFTVHEFVSATWFSDTLLLYTREDTPKADQALIQAVGWLTFFSIASKPTFLENPCKLRGAIAYGELFVDPERNLFFGKPIVDAYKLEQKQQWSGVALTESARKRLQDSPQSRGRHPDWLTNYSVPCKDQKTIDALAINWPTNGIVSDLEWSLKWSQKNEVPTDSDWEECGEVCEKWKNTKAFYEAPRTSNS
jgi:hypothetical protein